MKPAITIFLLLCFLSMNAQQRKEGVVKINGDTIWCDEVTIRFNAKNQVKVAKCEGGPVSEVDGSEIAFVIFSSWIEIVSDKGYLQGRVLIWGKNYYLTVETDDNGVSVFSLLDKNRKYIKKMKTGRAIFGEIREYFGDCDEFIAEIDKAEENFKMKTYKKDVIDLSAKYVVCNEN